MTVSLMGGAYVGSLNLTGLVSTFAGTGSTGSNDGTALSSTYSSPYGITSDGTNLYITDSLNHRLRKINISTGVVTTIAGASSGYFDGLGSGAAFNTPIGITTDNSNIYVADYGNHRIRKMSISTGIVITIAGSVAGYTDGWGTGATFNFPNGIVTDGTYLFVADQNNHRIRKVNIATQEVSTLAGSTAGYQDGTGTGARFDFPTGITSDGKDLFVSDSNNNRIRKINIASAVVTTLAGSTGGYADGTGAAAQFSFPFHITMDAQALYVVDQNNNRVRKVLVATGVVTTLAGAAAGYANGTGAAATFTLPRGIATDGKSLFVVDQTNVRIRKIE